MLNTFSIILPPLVAEMTLQPLLTNSLTFANSSIYYLTSHASIGDDNIGNFICQNRMSSERKYLIHLSFFFSTISFFLFFAPHFLIYFLIMATSNCLRLLCKKVLSPDLKVTRFTMTLSVFPAIPQYLLL